MGGSGSYYHRDVTPTVHTTNTKGYSAEAEEALGRDSIDSALLPKGDYLKCVARNPLVYCLDETGSMGTLPRIIYDKWPGIVGQITARGYLPDPEMSIAAFGDIRSDQSPLQVCDFDSLRNLDRWFKRLHMEGYGGGQGSESYEMIAYYYLNYLDMPNAELPIFLMTGDEACVDELHASDLRTHFGGEHESTTAKIVFDALLKKFDGNVFRIHRTFHNRNSEGWTNESIVAQWERLIGKERIIQLPEDRAIGDVTLGLYAVVSGARTVDEYIADMSTRPLDLAEGEKFEPQSPQRIAQVAKALEPLHVFKPTQFKATSAVGRGAVTATSSRKSTPA